MRQQDTQHLQLLYMQHTVLYMNEVKSVTSNAHLGQTCCSSWQGLRNR